MNQLRWVVAAVCIVAMLVGPATASGLGRTVPDRYVVVLDDSASVGSVTAAHEALGVKVVHTYRHALKGYSATIPASLVRTIEADPRVDFVTRDREGVAIQAQTLPAGVNRFDADLSTALAGDGAGQTAGDVAVFDTGIQTSHPDLNVAGGVNCLDPADVYNDGTIGDSHGHGTHIGGTIGAKDDANGVVGVAPGVRLWSVRVLNRLGSGSVSSQLCGIDWITGNGPGLGIRVVNSSVGMFTFGDDGNCGLTNDDVLHRAICRSTQAGILWVFAAGNNGGDLSGVNGPSYEEVLTVTAVADGNGTPDVGSTATFTCPKPPNGTKRSQNYTAETDDRHASFSSYAVQAADVTHTIAAPGACIYSTYLGSGYSHMSGTSMAAPHAVGAAHLCIVSGQCAGTPAETIQKLRADAAAYAEANPGFGFAGDPQRPVAGKYFGHLVRAGLY